MMNRYENYKNSKIDWIGKIPKDWNICSTRYLCDITTGNRDTQDKKSERRLSILREITKYREN